MDSMRTAILIVNEYLNSNKFNEIHMWLVEAAKRYGIQLKIYTNAQIMVSLGFSEDNRNLVFDENINLDLDENIKVDLANNINLDLDENIKLELDGNIKPEFILFWDKDIHLAKYLELLGYLVFNSSHGIEVCDDKALTHIILQNAGIPMPKTILAPMTFDGIGYTNYDFVSSVINRIEFPMIIKERFGSFGQQVYLVKDKEEMIDKIKEIGTKPMLFQEFIKSSFARDIRLNVVGEKVVASMYRYSDTGDFRANISNGGKMKPYKSTKEQEDLAINCCKLLGLDFAGVDIMFGKMEEPIICEVNSNAHFKNIYDCTGVNVANYMIEHILSKLNH